MFDSRSGHTEDLKNVTCDLSTLVFDGWFQGKVHALCCHWFAASAFTAKVLQYLQPGQRRKRVEMGTTRCATRVGGFWPHENFKTLQKQFWHLQKVSKNKDEILYSDHFWEQSYLKFFFLLVNYPLPNLPWDRQFNRKFRKWLFFTLNLLELLKHGRYFEILIILRHLLSFCLCTTFF